MSTGKQNAGVSTGCGVVLILLTLCAAAGAVFFFTPAPAVMESPKAPGKTEAWSFVKEAVRQKLISPGTADFGSVLGEFQDPESTVRAYPNGAFRVVGWVDSQNRLGAKLRADFFATVELRNGRWIFTEGPDVQERHAIETTLPPGPTVSAPGRKPVRQKVISDEEAMAAAFARANAALKAQAERAGAPAPSGQAPP